MLFGAYLTRAVALPVRRAATMAGRLADGDLSTRMPETGAGEVGALERSFNTMAASLESSRDELRLIAEEQAALRRVATLVARDVPADELFEAVPAEVRTVIGADGTGLLRYEDGETAVFLAGNVGAGEALPSGTRITLEDASRVGAGPALGPAAPHRRLRERRRADGDRGCERASAPRWACRSSSARASGE